MVRMLDHGFYDCPLIVTKNPGRQVSVSTEVDLKVGMWRGWWHFVFFPHEQCLSDFNLTRREGGLQFEKRHQAKWCPREAEEQNESSFWAWGWGQSQRRGGRELRCHVSSLPSQPAHKVQPKYCLLSGGFQAHPLCAHNWRNYSYLWKVRS